LVFFNPTGAGTNLLINPDLWPFLKLEEKASGIRWDPPKGIEAVCQHVIEPGELEIVEILVEYLSKYLQARQMALLVQDIRRVQISNPPARIRRGDCNDGVCGAGGKSQRKQ
jgi:hypothetical protein